MDILMPQLGESVTEGTLGKWLVAPGEAVKKYQPIAEVITDKVNAEIPAPADGVVANLVISEGTTVKVGTLIAVMNAAGEVAAPAAAAPAAAQAPAAAAAGGARPAALAGAAVASLDRPKGEAAGRYSPAVLKLAQEHGLDLSRLSGSGLGGRITRKDVEAYIASGAAAQPAQDCVGGMVAAQAAAPAQVAAAPVAPAYTPAPAPQPLAADQIIPVDAVRRRIAEKMTQSKHEAPHAWTMMPVDVTGLVKLKEQMGDEFKRREGVSLSYVPFFIKAVVESLKEFPIINSQWAGDSIIIKKEINISIAVATETSLAVPVIKNADRLSIAGLNHAVADLAARARAGKLTLDDISGGTFTVNNTGYFGSFMSAPIINHPQAAILSFEAVTKTPVVLENDAIAIRSMMNICMSLDHRILDGLVCGRFLQAVKARLQGYGPGTVTLY
ncbi:MAG TPA: dihydrolipoamide acetyltransferase family protein [Symbiobacteriaceae bacterium]|nr:dihydrolipoamide acetyltransferase family protein [Symbiobacteriaceae bacterium]